MDKAEKEKTAPIITTTDRKSVYCNLSEFCVFAKPQDIIEMTEFTNGEGFDVDFILDDKPDKRYQFTWGEIRAIIKLYKQFK